MLSDRFCVTLWSDAVKSAPNAMITKFYSKKQLAIAAGVSRTTFYRWMLNDQQDLTKMGVQQTSRLLPPEAVVFICQKHDIKFEKLP